MIADKSSKSPAAEKEPAEKKPAEKSEKKAEEKTPSENAAEKPDSVKVKCGPLVVKVELSGVFEAPKTAEIVLRPKQWSDLKVLDAVEHGATVRRGDPLVTLDFEKIDLQIADLQTQLRLKDLEVALAEQQLRAADLVVLVFDASRPLEEADRRLAEARHAFMTRFFRRFLEELDGRA